MTPSSSLLSLLLAGSALAHAVAIPWTPLSCPHAGSPFTNCSLPPTTSDVAVTLFYQIESLGSAGGGFSCGNERTSYCARSWTQPESGSAGSCYFLLAAGSSYACTATGGAVNVIDAMYTPLANGTLLAAPLAVSCPGNLTLSATSPGPASCTSVPLDHDVWVTAAWVSMVGSSAFECHYAADDGPAAPLCASAAAASGAGDASSCSFLLAANSALTCVASAGSVAFSSSTGVSFAAPYSGPAHPPAVKGVCPPAVTNKTNDCDCAFTNTAPTSDALVALTASSIDGTFSALHCFIDGVNVCGFGSNSGMEGHEGSCAFLLPAGESYACSMEWGALSYPATSVTVMSRSIFAPPRDDRHANIGKADVAVVLGRGVRAPSPAGNSGRLQRLWAAWRTQYGVAYGDVGEEAARFLHFTQHVAAADAAVTHTRNTLHLDDAGLPTRFNRFADMSRGEWEAVYRGRGGRRQLSHGDDAGNLPPPPPPPAAFDWRSRGVVTPVKDQGQCGSCWAFSTTGALESAWAVAGQPLLPLSEQQLVSCDTITNDGCGGGWPYAAISWVGAHGVATEASYPYASGGGTAPPCNTSAGVTPAPVNATGYRIIPGNTSAGVEDALAAWVAEYGPVSILVDAMTQL